MSVQLVKPFDHFCHGCSSGDLVGLDTFFFKILAALDATVVKLSTTKAKQSRDFDGCQSAAVQQFRKWNSV